MDGQSVTPNWDLPRDPRSDFTTKTVAGGGGDAFVKPAGGVDADVVEDFAGDTEFELPPCVAEGSVGATKCLRGGAGEGCYGDVGLTDYCVPEVNLCVRGKGASAVVTVWIFCKEASTDTTVDGVCVMVVDTTECIGGGIEI